MPENPRPYPEAKLRRFFQLGATINRLSDERAKIREEMVAKLGTGQTRIGPWNVVIASFDQMRFDRKAAEAELGTLERFEKPTPTLRVDVKLAPDAILDLLEADA